MNKPKLKGKVVEKSYAIVRGGSIFCGPTLMFIFHPVDKWKAEKKLEEMDAEFSLVEATISYTLPSPKK